eukprot:TRINITY_DN22196_c0_g1_i1.p1 TRINITY_DN22196_c0_g1~~TRINITY_DN22196_c0_g1_i1.p1  ORF type:complete len:550 (+),score=145.79 TRINITY_DN22196_c0_g1_i1:47-1651(+)
MSVARWEWAALLCLRVAVACTQPTSGPPDEYWQGPEVGYYMVYGKGWLTWEWESGIRSWLHPAMFWAVFAGMRAVETVLGATLPGCLAVLLPRALQGGIAFAADGAVYALAKACAGKATARTVFLMTATSWFASYCTTRTFSNSAEALLTLCGVCCAVWGRDAWFLQCAGAATAMRTTSAVTWAVVIAARFLFSRRGPAPDWGFARATVWATVMWVAASTCLDAAAAGRWYFSPWEFLKFNVLEGKSAAFGVHPWHWYFTQGFPAMLGPYLPWVAVAVHHAWSPPSPAAARCPGNPHGVAPRHLLALAGAVLSAYSFTGHKEFRFVLPVLYLCFVPAGHALTAAGAATRRRWLVGMTVANALLGVAFCYVHQTGGVHALTHVRTHYPASRVPVAVHLLLPCYSTPGFSYLHGSAVDSLVQFDCAPVETAAAAPAAAGLVTEHDCFKAAPLAVARWLYEGGGDADAACGEGATVAAVFPRGRRRALPDVFLLSSHQRGTFAAFFAQHGFVEAAAFPNTPVPVEWVQHEVLLYSRP